MSELFKEIKNYHVSGEINFEIEDKQGALAALKSAFSDGKQSELDGISVLYDDWKFNARESTNDPVIRLTLEARSKKVLDAKLAAVKKVIESVA